MEMVKSMLKEELAHSLEVLEHYRRALSGLPSGALVKKRIHGGEYWYRVFREGSKVRTEYVGKVNGEEAAAALRDQEKRKRYRELEREVRQKIRYLEKVIHARAV
ncbi:MAG: hypothetical protein RDV48_29665 [Candidatus Eremiobacteraeota bacterium]|nr:hypothetical protein [Candidatus Eremiobacteraeota bacterium]